jgi:hypothetical protein
MGSDRHDRTGGILASPVGPRKSLLITSVRRPGSAGHEHTRAGSLEIRPAPPLRQVARYARDYLRQQPPQHELPPQEPIPQGHILVKVSRRRVTFIVAAFHARGWEYLMPSLTS